jgi:hypothetical protein
MTVQDVAGNNQRRPAFVEVQPVHLASLWIPARRRVRHVSTPGKRLSGSPLVGSSLSSGMVAIVSEELSCFLFEPVTTLKLQGSPEKLVHAVAGGTGPTRVRDFRQNIFADCKALSLSHITYIITNRRAQTSRFQAGLLRARQWRDLRRGQWAGDAVPRGRAACCPPQLEI